MDERIIIENGNFELYAKKMLDLGIDYAIKGDFISSSNYIRKGLDIVTCDCLLDWGERINEAISIIFSEKHKDNSEYHFLFVKAFFSFYSDDEEVLKSGSDANKKGLEIIESERNRLNGIWYKKGHNKYAPESKMVKELTDFQFQSYYIAGKYSSDSKEKIAFYDKMGIYSRRRNLYRKLRWQIENNEDYDESLLYSTFFDNLSSSCCARLVCQNYFKKEKEIKNSYTLLRESRLAAVFIKSKDIRSFIEFGILYGREFTKDSRGHSGFGNKIVFRNQLIPKSIEFLVDDILQKEGEVKSLMRRDNDALREFERELQKGRNSYDRSYNQSEDNWNAWTDGMYGDFEGGEVDPENLGY